MKYSKVIFRKEVVDSLLTYSRISYPNEGILLLRGRRRNDALYVESVVVPPAAVQGGTFSSFNWFLLPPDINYVGVAHSHPSGFAVPSKQDLLHASGAIMVIIGYPFSDESCIFVYDREGKKIFFEVENK